MKTITNPDDVCNRMLAPALSGLNMDHENVDRGVDFDTDPLGAIYELADTDHSYTDTASPEQRRTKRRDDFLADLLEAWDVSMTDEERGQAWVKSMKAYRAMYVEVGS